jgi:PAS domain S-box-containing protein
MYNELNRYAGASVLEDWEDDGGRKTFVPGELTIELERAHALTRSILSTSRDGILSMNEDGQIEMANPAAEQIFGYPSGQLLRMNLTSLLEVPKDQSVTDFLEDAIVERISNLKKSGKDVTGKLASGTEVPLSAVFARTSTKKQVVFTCTLRELAAIHQSSPELNGNGSEPARNRRIGDSPRAGARVDLLAGMNHQIRTPMNAVLGMTGLLLESKLTPEQREYAETVLTSGENLLEIINDIVDFTKIESSRLELEELRFNLFECLEDAVDLMVSGAATKNLDIGYSVDEEVPAYLIADRARVRQVLVNLLSNAVKSTVEGGISIKVSMEQREGSKIHLLFAVSDTGSGIAADHMEHIFDPVGRAGGNSSEQSGGTGLGLAISKSLAALMGGALWVESQPGKGSTFFFTMQARVEKAAQSEPKLLTGTHTVLLIDTGRLTHMTFESHAKRVGLTMVNAHSVAEAAKILAKYEMDAVVVATSLSGQDGKDVVAALAKSLRKDPPVVMLGSLGINNPEAAFGMKPAGWLSQPIKALNFDHVFGEILGGVPSTTLSGALNGAAQDSLSAEAVAPSAPRARKSLRVLVAEDNSINQKVAVKMIKSLGYRADVASNGMEVLDALNRQPYDIVLMDVQMPEMDGLEATRRIRSMAPKAEGPHIVAMTANATQRDEDVCLTAGMDEYLAKPVRITDLKAVFDRWCEANPDLNPEPQPSSHKEPMTGLTGAMAELQSLGGDELVAELLGEFQLQVEADLSEIGEAAKNSDYGELLRLAHRLKGGSTTIGITTVTVICIELEKAAQDQDDRRIASIVDRLNREVVRTRTLYGTVNEGTKTVRILLADDHPVVRFGVRRMLQSHSEFIVVGEASDGKEAIREIREMQPDILLLDLNMPNLPGLETLRELTTIQIPTKTILLTSAISQREILEALQLGARGVVLKDALTTDLATCITTVVQGDYWLGRKPVKNLVQVLNDLTEEIKQPPKNTFGLTTRELEIVRLIAQGMTNKDVAKECDIAEETVKRHLKNIFDKVGVWNRLELALFAINNGLVGDNSAPAEMSRLAQ